LDRLKAGYFTISATASLAASYYFNYLFFFLRDRYGFGNRENLAVAALHGAIYIVASWQAGRFAERRAFIPARRSARVWWCVSRRCGCQLRGVVRFCLAAYTVPVCFPAAIEALIVEHEPLARVPHMIGVYNRTWSSSRPWPISPVADCTTGWGVAIFVIPAVFPADLIIVIWLDRYAAMAELRMRPVARYLIRIERFRGPCRRRCSPPAAGQPVLVRRTGILATMPTIAERRGLSPARVGHSVGGFFGRLAAFIWL
jgi:hypothetical protein